MARSKASARTYHHGDLRTAILGAASELLREQGVDRISLRECARRVGVSHAAPYRHFANKEALVAALAAEGFDRLREAGAKAMVGLRRVRPGRALLRRADPLLARSQRAELLSSARCSGRPRWRREQERR
jgi:AcrR family transcriptional regulator